MHIARRGLYRLQRPLRSDPSRSLVKMSVVATAPADVKQTYAKVEEKLKEMSALGGISGLLQWDELVMMPGGSSASRGAQKAVLAGVMHDKKTDKELGELLKALKENDAALDNVAKAVVRDALKDYIKATAIPKDLAQRIAKLETDAYNAWVSARKESDWSKFAPFLQEWVDINKQRAALINPNMAAYDVLLDDYEKGMTTERLDVIFSQVRDGVIPLIARLKENISVVDPNWIKGEFDVDKQSALCRQVALDIGFDLEKGRLDVSVHPFTGGAHPTDVRMTTRFKTDDVLEGLTGAIHETGHALYEQGRNLDYDGLPVNASMSMGIHESQSLLWERMVALGRPFAKYLLPKLADTFPGTFGNVSAEKLYEAQNAIKDPSYIRVESDEVTYVMHIILRYEMERGLMDGSIKVEDVPAVWNEKMKTYLGAEPPSDAQGALQDVHWSAGAFGYFPTYSLGAMYATQIYQTAKSQIPDMEAKIEQGDFAELKAWLNEHVHKLGSLHASGDELMEAVTGSQLDATIFLKYLTDKYTDLYKL